MNTEIIATEKVEGDALELSATIEALLIKLGIEKEIVNIDSHSFTAIQIERETLTDGSIVYNMNLVEG